MRKPPHPNKKASLQSSCHHLPCRKLFSTSVHLSSGHWVMSMHICHHLTINSGELLWEKVRPRRMQCIIYSAPQLAFSSALKIYSKYSKSVLGCFKSVVKYIIHCGGQQLITMWSPIEIIDYLVLIIEKHWPMAIDHCLSLIYCCFLEATQESLEKLF